MLFAFLAARSEAVRATLALYAGPNNPNLRISQAPLGADADGPTAGDFDAKGTLTSDSPPGSQDFSRLKNMSPEKLSAGIADGSLLTSFKVVSATLRLDASLNLRMFDGKSRQERDTVDAALHELGHADQAGRHSLEFYRQSLQVNQMMNGKRLPHDRRPVERYANEYRDKAVRDIRR